MPEKHKKKDKPKKHEDKTVNAILRKANSGDEKDLDKALKIAKKLVNKNPEKFPVLKSLLNEHSDKKIEEPFDLMTWVNEVEDRLKKLEKKEG